MHIDHGAYLTKREPLDQAQNGRSPGTRGDGIEKFPEALTAADFVDARLQFRGISSPPENPLQAVRR